MERLWLRERREGGVKGIEEERERREGGRGGRERREGVRDQIKKH